MMVGNESQFAVESCISKAYARLSFRALGFFVIHIRGKRYGVSKPDATLLACSFDEIVRRIARRGMHTAPFVTGEEAGTIADSYCNAIYGSGQEQKRFFGIPHSEFRRLVHANRLAWAPDGDAAFDDGSHVLHFDIRERVRLIAFRCCFGGCNHDPTSLSDIWLGSDEFYDVLERWRAGFEAEWVQMPKSHDDETGYVS
jgi:hypothetical protein